MKSGGSNYGILKWQKPYFFGVFITQFCAKYSTNVKRQGEAMKETTAKRRKGKKNTNAIQLSRNNNVHI